MRYTVLIGCIVLLGMAGTAQAYSVQTHAYLTREILDLYNKNYPTEEIPLELIEDVVQGAEEEDAPPRWMNHFYDPVRKVGLTFLGQWPASGVWATSEALQNKSIYSALGNRNFTWQRGMRAYARGEDHLAMLVLGHMLHLLEDLGVPDHARNDPHGDGSPYEDWAAKYGSGNVDLGLKEVARSKGPIERESLNDFFDELALYSNKNFYSKNSIGKYDDPRPFRVQEDGEFLKFFHQGPNGEGILLHKRFSPSSVLIQENSSEGTAIFDEEVMRSYWMNLSPMVVRHGAGLIRLFLEEARRAKNDQAFIKEEKTSFMGKVIQRLAWIPRRIRRTETKPDPAALPKSPVEQRTPMPEEAYLQGDNMVAEYAPLRIEERDELQPSAPSAILTSDHSTSFEPEVSSHETAGGKIMTAPVPEPVYYAEIPSNYFSGPRGGIREEAPPEQFIPEQSNATSTSGAGNGAPPEDDDTAILPLLPSIRNFTGTLDPKMMLGEFRWEPGDTSAPLLYRLLEEESGTSTVRYAGTSTTASLRLYEASSTRMYTLEASDPSGATVIATTTVSVPGFLQDAYFYRSTRGATAGQYVLDLRYDKRPFIPNIWGSETGWQGLVFYMNQDPNPANHTLHGEQAQNPDDLSGILGVNGGYSAVFGLAEGNCFASAPTGLMRNCFNLPTEDLRLVLVANLPGEAAIGDYVTTAYYDHYQNRGLEQVAYDRSRIYFQDTIPSNQPPSEPDAWVSFDKSDWRINLNWASSTDPDSLDGYLYYETNMSKTGIFSGERWVKYGKHVYYEPGYVPFWITEPGMYHFAVRVYDEYENMSETITTITITPDGEVVTSPPS